MFLVSNTPHPTDVNLSRLNQLIKMLKIDQTDSEIYVEK